MSTAVPISALISHVNSSGARYGLWKFCASNTKIPHCAKLGTFVKHSAAFLGIPNVERALRGRAKVNQLEGLFVAEHQIGRLQIP